MTTTWHKQKGQMLIEVVVAVGIIALVLIGVSDLMTRSSRVVTFQKQKDEAVAVAQKCLNEYRTQRDSNPPEFYDKAVNGNLAPCVSDAYTGSITLGTVVGSDSVRITVRVEWNDGGQTFSVSLLQYLSREIK